MGSQMTREQFPQFKALGINRNAVAGSADGDAVLNPMAVRKIGQHIHVQHRVPFIGKPFLYRPELKPDSSDVLVCRQTGNRAGNIVVYLSGQVVRQHPVAAGHVGPVSDPIGQNLVEGSRMDFGNPNRIGGQDVLKIEVVQRTIGIVPDVRQGVGHLLSGQHLHIAALFNFHLGLFAAVFNGHFNPLILLLDFEGECLVVQQEEFWSRDLFSGVLANGELFRGSPTVFIGGDAVHQLAFGVVNLKNCACQGIPSVHLGQSRTVRCNRENL